MGEALTDMLTKERDSKVSLVEQYKQAAADDGRDLTENEIGTITKARARVGEIDAQLAVLVDDLTIADDVADKLRRLSPGTAPASKYRSAGELLFDVLHQGEDDSRRRYTTAKKRAAEHMGQDAATTVPVAGDLGGLVVDPVVGPVIDPYPMGMPLANAIGLMPAPNSLHFMRPTIDDPNFAGGVGPQGTGGQVGFQKAELPSKAFDVTASPVALATVGGYLNVSQQLISLQPGSLDLIIRHMNRRLANSIDGSVAAAVVGTGATPIATPTDAAELQKAIWDAVAAYYGATNSLPTWIAMGPLGAAFLGGMTDAAGRPLFPYLGAANALGTADASLLALSTVAGLRPVMTPAITDTKLYIGGADGVEGYLYRFPVLEAVEPSVLGRQVAVAAAVGTFNPIADSIQVIGT